MCCRTKCFERFFCCCFVFSKLISFTVHYSLSASHGLFVVLLYLTFTLSLDLCSKFAYIHIPCTLVLALLIINTIACNSCTFSSPFLLYVCYRSNPLVFHVYVRVCMLAVVWLLENSLLSWSSFYHVGSRDRNQGVRLYLVIPVIDVFGRPLFQLIQLWLLHLHPPPPLLQTNRENKTLECKCGGTCLIPATWVREAEAGGLWIQGSWVI